MEVLNGTGSFECAECGANIRGERCCCDSGTFDDGSHLDGLCRACCGPHGWHPRDGIGGYERAGGAS